MNYNLTEKQKGFARWIVQQIRTNRLGETFYCMWDVRHRSNKDRKNVVYTPKNEPVYTDDLSPGALQALASESLIRVAEEDTPPLPDGFLFGPAGHSAIRCTVTGKLLKGVDTNFADSEMPMLVSTLAQPHPPEIAMSLDRLRSKYPDAKRLGFLVMRFTAARPFQRIVEVIKHVADQQGLIIVRADENEFHADLWGNVRTLLHGCGFGVAVYERIETNEPNANVGLEVGYLMAMNKPVLLLKDKTVPALQSDLAGKLYKPFDPHDPDGTIPGQLTKWLEDNGIIVPKAGMSLPLPVAAENR